MDLYDLIRILRETSTAEAIDKYREKLIELMPKAKIMLDFNQQNHAHQYDLWEQACRRVWDKAV